MNTAEQKQSLPETETILFAIIMTAYLFVSFPGLENKKGFLG